MGPFELTRSRLMRESKETLKTLTERIRALNKKYIMPEKLIEIFNADKYAASLRLEAEKVYTSSLLQVIDEQRKEIDSLKSLILSQGMNILNLEQQVNSQVEGQIDNEVEGQIHDHVESQFNNQVEGKIGDSVDGQVDATVSALGVTEATTTAEESAAVTASAEDAGLVEEIDCRDRKTKRNRRRRMRYKMSLKKKEAAQVVEEEEDMSADSGTTITEGAEPTSTIPSEGADAISADALNIAIAVDSLTCTDKVDQGSPQNPEGRRIYDRNFLLELRYHPLSMKRPDDLLDLSAVVNDGINQVHVVERRFSKTNRTPSGTPSRNIFYPDFMKGHDSEEQPTPWRNSQRIVTKYKNPVTHIELSLKEDVQLQHAENAWRPRRVKPSATNEEEAKTQDLYKKVRSVLNKLTPEKFDRLVAQVQSLPIDSSDRLEGIIKLIFEKAVDEPTFSEEYARMCKVLYGTQVPAECENKDESEINFRKLLLNQCQNQFEKNSEVELDREAAEPAKKKELQCNLEEELRRIRRKSLGNIRFIGELFKLGMLTASIMQRCIKRLLVEGDEQSECLCKLLTTVGDDLERKNQDLSECFSKMKELSQKKGLLSSRIRFMLQDLRKDNWVPRRTASTPKTMAQIQIEQEEGD
ncbi:eukaryotic translation initiation factor 4 gamma 3-like isoform X2 [Zootermopsis nevadensis]|uniref:eukaryotic translation initiation factor 4 gamma 3-like isoform X2 n=1 Tax=Zootermopsis nevadensis TaxID=136037 RepID=UPI000B8ED2DA|nr:eukaryotic translation initiation factor 4 gamma 3-like isoform X2 [Zootermopsis nevadensis]